MIASQIDRPLVILNKSDRPTSRPLQVESDLFDLFATLGATDAQMEYPVLYASAKMGWAITDMASIPPSGERQAGMGMQPLFDAILSHVPGPTQLVRAPPEPFRLLVVQIESGEDDFDAEISTINHLLSF